MKHPNPNIAGILAATALAAIPLWLAADTSAPPVAAVDPQMIVLTPDEIEWAAGPPSVPAGAEAALIEGDPSVAGEVFVLRLRFPAGYTLPPHVHPADERVTVISGTLNLGMGETLDRERGRPLPAGSQFMMPPGHAHYVWTADDEVVIQLTSIGPWDIRYVDPADDPRNAAQ
jgi:quercetin dioxygenase-like cupin family protein